jgi:hypothetical protein
MCTVEPFGPGDEVYSVNPHQATVQATRLTAVVR